MAQLQAPKEVDERLYASWSGRIVFGFSSLLLYLAVQFWDELNLSVPPMALTLIAILLIALHLVLVRKQIVGVDPLVWIPPAMLCFYFGMPIAIDLIPGTSGLTYDAWDMGVPRNLERGFAMALLTMTAFLWGLHLCPIARLTTTAPPANRTIDPLALSGLILAFGGLAMIALGVAIVGPSVAFASYGDVFSSRRSGLDFRFFDLGPTFARCGVLAILASHKKGSQLQTWFGIGLGLFLLLFMAVIGDRGGLVSFGLAVGWIYTVRVRALRPFVVVSLAAVVFLMLPAIKEFRVYRSIRDVQSTPVATLARDQIYEMGTSALVFGHTLDWIPKVKQYDWGLSFVRSVVHLVPNVGITSGKEFLPDPLEHSPSHWLTSTLNPIKFDAGGGYGYAIGAEWYFNFGVIGVFLGMAMIGYLVGYARNAATRSELALLLSALFFMMIVVSIRNILGAPLKAVVWPLVGILIIRAFVTQVVGSGSGRAPNAEPLAEDAAAS
jgi:oligosaccharide repeat unit polymerase